MFWGGITDAPWPRAPETPLLELMTGFGSGDRHPEQVKSSMDNVGYLMPNLTPTFCTVWYYTALHFIQTTATSNCHTVSPQARSPAQCGADNTDEIRWHVFRFELTQ